MYYVQATIFDPADYIHLYTTASSKILLTLERLSVTNLSSENNLPFRLNAPVVIRAKVKLVTDNLLSIYAAAN